MHLFQIIFCNSIFPIDFFLPDSDSRVSHDKISSRRYPRFQKFFEIALTFPHSVFARRTLLFAACFAQREFLHRPLLTDVFLRLRLICLLPIQNPLIEKSAFFSGKASADFCPFGDNGDLDMCFGICRLQQHQVLKHRKTGHFCMASDVF